MIDTVKILINVSDPLKLLGSKFAPITLEQLVYSSPGARTYLNPSPTYAKTGNYMPRLTMFKRFRKGMPVYQLAIEFSAPKMLFGNNFDELEENDFDKIVVELQSKLFELVGVRYLKSVFENATVNAWHPSKNIVFLDCTSCQTILNTISKLDISRVYDLQKTNFRDGHVIHIHCNSQDIAFYDKLADLRKSKISPKRSIDKDGLMQLNILDSLEVNKPFEVFRYEVRFVGSASIKRAFPQLCEWSFKNLFNRRLCQEVLIKHWQKITSSVDMIALDTKKPLELLQNYLIENPDADPKAALATIASILITSNEGVTAFRNTLDSHFGKQVWYRLRPTIKTPGENRFKSFMHIDEVLERFEPTHMSKFINNIEKDVNLW